MSLFAQITPEMMDKYSLSAELSSAHEEQFQQSSSQYEDALKELNLVFVVDVSGSMNETDTDAARMGRTVGFNGEKWTRWDNVMQAVKCLADPCFQYDADGCIPMIFFNNKHLEKQFRSVSDILTTMNAVQPTGTTNLLEALEYTFLQHLQVGKKALFIVLTDGEPNEGQKPQVKDLIRNTVGQADPSGDVANVLFIRVGDSPEAIAFLNDLDNCEEIGKNVDTKSDNALYKMGPKNLILNAIFEHLEGTEEYGK